jgi:ADP-ribose pyrophosphatase YjhB (NUDIX family)
LPETRAPRKTSRNEEPVLPSHRIISKLLQRYWRLSRGLTLGAQAAVIDPDGRILLIRHTYHPGWHFPGGGVECMEPVEVALARELDEEAGVALTGKPELFGIYANFRLFPNDHVAVFVVRDWRQAREPKPNYEIAEHAMFGRDALPPDINPPTARRIAEIFDGVPREPLW